MVAGVRLDVRDEHARWAIELSKLVPELWSKAAVLHVRAVAVLPELLGSEHSW